MANSTKVLKRLITTERSAALREGQNKYTFEVLVGASKGLIATEVAQTYQVEVEQVNIMIMPGKKRRLSRTQRFIRTPKWKKAVVKIKEGQKIEESGDAKSEDKKTKSAKKSPKKGEAK